MSARLTFAHCAFHFALSVMLLATLAPAAAQYAPRSAPSCACGPSAMPAYTPPYPQPAYRPLDGSLRSGVTYRQGRHYEPARTNLGSSAHEPIVGPALWSGFYAGLHGGYAWSDVAIGAPIFGAVDTSGGFGGVHLGHNWQRGALVFGVELDADKSWGSGARSFSSGFDVTADRNWTSSARLRAGYAFGDLLAYVTAGGAAAGVTVTATDGGGATWRRPETVMGYVYGAGLEWQATKQIRLRGEVLRYGFNERTMHVDGTTAPMKLDDTVVRGGVSFRLN